MTTGKGPNKPEEKLPDWKMKLEEFRKKLIADDSALKKQAEKAIKEQGNPQRGR